MSYALPDELALWMGVGETFVDPTHAARAELLLDAATGVVDDELGQSLTVSPSVDRLRGAGTAALVLSRWPVLAVDSVAVDGVALAAADYTWESAGILERVAGVWRCAERITVSLTAGHDPIPSSVRGLVLELATGSWDNPAAKKSERLGDWQAAWVRAGMSLSTSDRKVLRRYAANK